MAYDSTTKTITKPVNTSDVCSAIGEDKHRIGYLCVNENVNPQSKHKPMRHSTLAELTNVELGLLQFVNLLIYLLEFRVTSGTEIVALCGAGNFAKRLLINLHW